MTLKRYQVFISSTFMDLSEERQLVMRTVLEMGHIPAGMELFPAFDEEQWNFIKRVIDDSDYYIVIVGARYGSLTPDGVSFTEKEYDYAVAKGIKVTALLHGKPEDIPQKNAERMPELREKLDAFRAKLIAGRLVKFWTEARELPGLVALSLQKTIADYPAVGWIRGDMAATSDLLAQTNELRIQNEALREEAAQLQRKVSLPSTELAQGNERVMLHGLYHTTYGTEKTKSSVTWDDIFATIGPAFYNSVADVYARSLVESRIRDRFFPGRGRFDLNSFDIDTIAIQLSALGLIRIFTATSVKGGQELYWQLTDAGATHLTKVRAIKRGEATAPTQTLE